VKETVTDVSRSLARKSGSEEMILAFCRLCSVVKSQKAFWGNFEKLRKPL